MKTSDKLLDLFTFFSQNVHLIPFTFHITRVNGPCFFLLHLLELLHMLASPAKPDLGLQKSLKFPGPKNAMKIKHDWKEKGEYLFLFLKFSWSPLHYSFSVFFSRLVILELELLFLIELQSDEILLDSFNLPYILFSLINT